MDSKAIKKDFIRFMRAQRGGALPRVPRSIGANPAGKAPAALRPAPQQRQGMNVPPSQPQMALPALPGMAGGSTPVPRPLGAPTGLQGLGSQSGGSQSGGSQGLTSGLQRLAQLRGATSLYPPLGDSERF